MRRLKVFDGDAETFEDFFHKNADDVWCYVRRRVLNAEDADDVTAEVFATAWRRRENMPSTKEARLWLFGVARNTLSNHHRSTRRRDRLHLRLVTAAPTSTDGLIDHNSEIPRALSALNDDDRDLLIMRAWDGLAVNEIAVVLDITANAVSQRLAKARTRLSKQLDALNGKAKDFPAEHTENRPAGHVPSEPRPEGSAPSESSHQHVKEDGNG